MAIKIDTGKDYKIVLKNGEFYVLSLSKNVTEEFTKGVSEGCGVLTIYDSDGWVSLCVHTDEICYFVRDDL